MPTHDLSMAAPFLDAVPAGGAPRAHRRRHAPQAAATRADLLADCLALFALDPGVVAVRERPQAALFDLDGASSRTRPTSGEPPG